MADGRSSDPAPLPRRARLALAVQRGVGLALGILWIPLAGFILRVVLGYRIHEVSDVRRRFRRLVTSTDAPVLICANHLTMIDSAIVAWALGGTWWYVPNYHRMPWNLPERRNFAHSALNRAGAWLVKCIPITRGGSRDGVTRSLRKVQHVLSRGESALVFPEGGRSRSGRVEPENVTYGVGRILDALPDCRTLCVYLRGDRQESWSALPRRGDWFRVQFELFQPCSDSPSGLRRARELARQIVRRLHEMEQEYFARR
ncbi:MAG: lysophospholipid acyltransferase family protein, partial [Gemmatimonadota bacterium]|nr:lysophospholipid acyltransferase family protein [Gemmatimonadota bacterium]